MATTKSSTPKFTDLGNRLQQLVRDRENINAELDRDITDALNDFRQMCVELGLEEYVREVFQLDMPAMKDNTPEKKPQKKRGRKRVETEDRHEESGGNKYLRPGSLKYLIMEILSNHPHGISKSDIVMKIQEKIEKKEYETSTDSAGLLANISVALSHLKHKEFLYKDEENQKFFSAA